MFDRLLIANRGEIACRVIRTARRMGIGTVAVFSDADRGALHVSLADAAVPIGPAPAAQSYLRIDRIMDAVRATGAQAVHPGYGFLSENAGFARALESEGITFVGPPSAAIAAMGDKITAKAIAAKAGVSTVPGYTGLIEDEDHAVRIAREVGYPVMLKASAGGGGKGMRVARTDAEAREGFGASRREAQASFGDDRIFVERFVERPRHIEIQVLADGHGNCVHLHERECSIQRRNQKVIEEAPSPFLDAATRAAMGAQACALARAVGYASAGTVEFIVDADRTFYFLEMNTRLQVEHPVTELITGIDLVEQMIRVAAGERLPFAQDDIPLDGWAMEGRLYAEDPWRGFLPSTGRLTRYRPPREGRVGRPDGPTPNPRFLGDHDAEQRLPVVRNDTGVTEGGEISTFYDPMIAKLCTWAPTREGAIDAMRDALDAFEVEGIGHNLPFVAAVMGHPRFRSGDISTAFIAEEYPDGFRGAPLDGATLRRVAAAAAAMHRVAEIRRTRLSGTMDNHRRRVGDDWVVSVDGTDHPVTVAAGPDGSDVAFADGAVLRVTGGWTPGMTLARLAVDDGPLTMKVDKIPMGFRLRLRGADLRVLVRSPRAAALAARMPVREPPDTSRLLLCPMPGLVVRIDVAEGDAVHEGQPLATVEAMKMENTLRAARSGRIARINAAPGDTLRVDDVILEFE